MTLNYGNPGAFVTLWEDFLLDNVSESGALSNWLETSANSGTEDILNKHGGWWRQTISTGETDDTLLAAELAWEADEGFPIEMEVRLVTSDSSKSAIFVGLTDANTEAAGILPYDNENASVTSPATDVLGFLLEGEQDETWNAVGVQNGTDNTAVALTLGADSADAVVQVLRMEINPNINGTALYYIGESVEAGGGRLVSTQTGFFRSSIILVPMVGANGRATAYTVDYDYIFVQAPRS